MSEIKKKTTKKSSDVSKTKKVKKVSYISKSNKKYNVKKQKVLNLKAWVLVLLFPAIIIVMISGYLILESININGTHILSTYHVDMPETDYKVFLKDNDLYDKSYLDKNFEIPGNLVKTINPDFRFQFGSNEILDLNYTYKVTSELIISKTDENKPLDRLTDVIVKPQTKSLKSSSFSEYINLIIDYDEYNEKVNNYKRTQGWSVDGKLIVKFIMDIDADIEGTEEKFKKNYTQEIIIPLSEQSFYIDVTNNLPKGDEGPLASSFVSFDITNPFVFIIGVTLLVLGIISLGLAIYLFIVFRKKNIYTITLKKLLTEYDRLIVSGVVKGDGFDESQYDKIIEVHDFSEMVDAASNLNANILFYEVIPGEESYFILTNEDVMYKFKLTKAYLLNAKEKGEKGY